MHIKLHMFRDQHGAGRGSASSANRGSGSLAGAIPFKKWKVGYVVVTETNTTDEWTIKKIDSSDGQCHREDCVVSLQNVANEERTIKGSTLQSSYKLKGYGDASPPEAEDPTERDDVKPIGVNVAGIREFYERKDGRPGSRVLMLDKTAYVVMEDFNTIWAKVVAASTSAAAAFMHDVAGHGVTRDMSHG